MFAYRASMSRSSLWAALRRRAPASAPQSSARRGYATLQERVALSNERQWQMAALAVTIPGLVYLRSGKTPKPGHTTPQKAAAKEKAPPQHQPAAEVTTESAPREKFEAAIEKTQDTASKLATSSASGNVMTASAEASEQAEPVQAQEAGESASVEG